MSDMTPPGWYPDAAAPGSERWWDGTAWTAHLRPAAPAAPAVAAAPAAPAAPAHQGFGPPVPAPAPALRAHGTRTLALAAAGLLVVGAAVTGAVLLGRDGDGDGPASGAAPSASVPPSATTAPSPAGSPAEADPKVLVDQLNGITLPIPSGWEKPDRTVEQVPTMRTVGSYDCPSSPSRTCYHGTVTSRTANATGTTSAEKLAKSDIVTAADGAYEESIVGDRTHGGIVSHQQLDSAPVAVAGRAGYQVRWRVRTAQGPGGYVQSLVFPSTVGTEALIIVRYAFDAGPDGPPLSLMDTVTKAIRPVGDSTATGGVGSSIAP
ncbi:DUF2510 domain-containing protein [Streptomyces sp. NPDC058195]|uniref:DUF2510 domain-containing protein n=1 Tax=Streptomyces sp. NPDC058195 TaxID=3346375 RepID=UPI0036E435E6